MSFSRLLLSLSLLFGIATGFPTPASAVPGGAIVGSVLDEASGNPVAEDVKVQLSLNGEVLATESVQGTGNFSFYFLAAGTYDLEVLLPEASDTVVGGAKQQLEIADFQTAQFSFSTTGVDAMVAISGRIFEDVNGDGIWSSGDVGIENSVAITGAESAQSGADGIFEGFAPPSNPVSIRAIPHFRYEFPFTLSSTPPVGATTNPWAYVADLTGQTEVTGFDFATKATGQVDLTVNPVSTETGFPIAGAAKLELTQNGKAIANAEKRAGDNSVSMGWVDAGTYDLKVTVGAKSANVAVVLKEEPFDITVSPKLDLPSKAKVSGVMYEDLNGNGVWDASDTTFTQDVYKSTSSEGNSWFAASGGTHVNYLNPTISYNIEAWVPNGYEIVKVASAPKVGTSGAAGFLGVVVEAGQTLSGYDVIVKSVPPEYTGSISGRVYNKTTKVPAAYGTVELWQGGQLLETSYGTFGNYEFVNLPPGTYEVVSGLSDTGKSGPIVVDANEKISEDLFVFDIPQMGVVQGTVYDDQNLNGRHDTGEPGIGDVQITSVWSEEPNALLVVVTDNNGNYRIPVAPTGTTTITEAQPEGWLDGEESKVIPVGTSQDDAYVGIVVDTNGVANGYDFAEYRDQAPPTIKVTPVDGTVLAYGVVAEVKFSCEDTGGTALESCVATIDGEPIENGHFIDTTAVGNHILVVKAADKIGNKSTETVNYTVSPAPDTSAPVINYQPDNGAVIAYGSEAVATFTCVDGGGSEIATCVATIDGTKISSPHTIDTKLVGSHVMVITATDGAGNSTTETASYTITRAPDSTPPIIEFAPKDGTVLAYGAVATVTFVCSDVGGSGLASCTATLDGAPIVYGHPIFTEVSGDHELVFTATDVDGNETVEKATFTISPPPDAIPPTVEFSPADGTLVAYGFETTVEFSCYDQGGSRVAKCNATLDGKAVREGTAIDTTAIGDHTLVVTAIDGAGNITSEIGVFTISEKPDTDAPSVTIEPADGTVVKFATDVVVTYTCTDPTGSVQSCTATVNGENIASGATVNSAAAETFTITVTAVDDSGNTAVETSQFTVTARPEVTKAETVPEIVGATDYNNESHAEVLRLYQAIFGRYPDVGGAKYWIGVNNDGSTVLDIAGYMTGSTEWAAIYDNTTDAEFVGKVYANVLGREFDQKGYEYWLGLVSSGELKRHEMVYYVTANSEFTTQYPFTNDG